MDQTTHQGSWYQHICSMPALGEKSEKKKELRILTKKKKKNTKTTIKE